MAKKSTTTNLRRLEVFPYFNGINTLVADNISKKQELSHAENARSKTIGTIEKREGTRRLGNAITATANYGLFFFENSTDTGFFRISTVSATTSIYYLNGSATWTALAGGGTGLTGAQFDYTIAESCCFLVNGNDVNRYISADGTTVVTSATSTGHLYNSPKAFRINYYKNRLYVGDYYVSATEYKNGIMRSSNPLGIITLVDGDHAAADCGADDWIKVTDTKYIYTTDTVDIYRGDTKIADLTIKAKTEDSFQINAITFVGAYTTLNSADEVWVDGTYSGTKVFRWAGNPASGTDVKQYDTFKITGGQNDKITMMENIGEVMVIANKNNLAIWNDYNLKNLDLGIGCSSKTGYVKALGTLFFLDYSGIYTTTGETPKLISAKVQRYIDGATTTGLESSAAGKKGKSVFFSIPGDVTLYRSDGSKEKVLSDIVIEFNFQQANWFVHTGIKATQFATYISSSDPDRLEFASTETGYHVFEFLTGMVDDRVSEDKEIPFRIDSGNITLAKEFEKIVYPMEIIIETERGSGIDCFISLDNDSWYQIEGQAEKGLSILKVSNRNLDDNKPPRCRRLKISLRDYTKKLVKISRVAIIYADSLEEEETKIDYKY